MNRIPDGSMSFYSKVVGIGLLLIPVLAGFSNGFVLKRLVVENDAMKTLTNLTENEMLLRAGVVCIVFMLLLDVVVAWAFYALFKPISLNLSLLAAWPRLLYTSIFGAALYHLAIIAQVLDDKSSLTADQVMLFLRSFHSGWLISLMFFALHLFILGYLIIRSSGYVPKLIGYLLILAAIAFAAVSLAYLLLPDYNDYEAILLATVTVCGISGELILALWLLIKGVKMQPLR